MPYIIPQPYPAPQTGFGQFAGVLGGQLEKYQDLLLQALLSGQLAGVPQQTVAPTGNLQGLQLPGGQQFSGKPQAAQRLIPDYIRNLQSQVNMGRLPVGGLPTGFGATPTGQSRMRLLPPLTRPLQQTQLQQAQTEIEEAPLKRRKLEQDIEASKADIARSNAMTEWVKTFLPSSTPGEDVTAFDDTGNPVPGKIVTIGNRRFIASPTADGKSIKLTDATDRATSVRAQVKGEYENLPSQTTLQKPSVVDQHDWDAATDEQKRALLSRLGL